MRFVYRLYCLYIPICTTLPIPCSHYLLIQIFHQIEWSKISNSSQKLTFVKLVKLIIDTGPLGEPLNPIISLASLLCIDHTGRSQGCNVVLFAL
jgi:hypothetical protein